MREETASIGRFSFSQKGRDVPNTIKLYQAYYFIFYRYTIANDSPTTEALNLIKVNKGMTVIRIA